MASGMIMYCMVIWLVALSVALADPNEEEGSYHHGSSIHSTTLGHEANTPDPLVSEDVRRLLAETDYTNDQIHYMPQHVANPDCYVVTYVIKEQRHGGRCSRMAGGLPFCGVKNYVYPNHPDCVNSDASGDSAWASSRWGPYFSRSAETDSPTESTNDDDVETDGSENNDDDDGGTEGANPRFKRDVKQER